MKLSKRVIAVVLSAGLVLCNFSTTASEENKSLTTNYPPSDKSQISYNTSDYTLYCISRVKVKCKSDYRSMWSKYCRWDYDYISKNGNKSWNSYLFSSSRVSGQVVYSTGTTKPTSGNRKSKIPEAIKYEIIFGAGNKSNGKVANRMGASTNRNMSYDSDTITLSY